MSNPYMNKDEEDMYFKLKELENNPMQIVFKDCGEEKDNPFAKGEEKPLPMIRYVVEIDGKEKTLDTASKTFNIGFAKAHKKLIEEGIEQGMVNAVVLVTRSGSSRKTRYQFKIIDYEGKE